MPWFPTKGSIRRHMISQSEGSQRSSQLAKYNPMYSFPSNSAAPAASVRVSVSAWQSHATINQICGRKRRKWCGLTAASQWRKPNYTARRSPPPHHHPAAWRTLSLSLPCLPTPPLPLNIFIPSLLNAVSLYESKDWRSLLVAKSHLLHLFSLNLSLHVMCSNPGAKAP